MCNYVDFNNPSSLLSKISTDKRKEMWKTCICSSLARYLEQIKRVCFVMNWKNSENITNFIDNWGWVYTKVTPL